MLQTLIVLRPGTADSRKIQRRSKATRKPDDVRRHGSNGDRERSPDQLDSWNATSAVIRARQMCLVMSPTFCHLQESPRRVLGIK